jgi:hypothetical protein
MSDNQKSLNVTPEQLDDIIKYVATCKLNGNCSQEVKEFSKNIAIPEYVLNRVLMNKQYCNNYTPLTKNNGEYLVDGSYKQT